MSEISRVSLRKKKQKASVEKTGGNDDVNPTK